MSGPPPGDTHATIDPTEPLAARRSQKAISATPSGSRLAAGRCSEKHYIVVKNTTHVPGALDRPIGFVTPYYPGACDSLLVPVGVLYECALQRCQELRPLCFCTRPLAQSQSRSPPWPLFLGLLRPYAMGSVLRFAPVRSAARERTGAAPAAAPTDPPQRRGRCRGAATPRLSAGWLGRGATSHQSDGRQAGPTSQPQSDSVSTFESVNWSGVARGRGARARRHPPLDRSEGPPPALDGAPGPPVGSGWVCRPASLDSLTDEAFAASIPILNFWLSHSASSPPPKRFRGRSQTDHSVPPRGTAQPGKGGSHRIRRTNVC